MGEKVDSKFAYVAIFLYLFHMSTKYYIKMENREWSDTFRKDNQTGKKVGSKNAYVVFEICLTF